MTKFLHNWEKLNRARNAYKTPFRHKMPNQHELSKEELKRQLEEAAANTKKQQDNKDE